MSPISTLWDTLSFPIFALWGGALPFAILEACCNESSFGADTRCLLFPQDARLEYDIYLWKTQLFVPKTVPKLFALDGFG